MSFLGRLINQGKRRLGRLASHAQRIGRPLARAIHDAKPCVHKIGKDLKQVTSEIDKTPGLGDVAAPFTAAGRRAIERATEAVDVADRAARTVGY